MNQEAAPTQGEQQLLATLSARHVVTRLAGCRGWMSTGHKADRGQPGGRDAQNRKIWRKVPDLRKVRTGTCSDLG